MYCVNCGEEIDNKADVCVKCGISTIDKNKTTWQIVAEKLNIGDLELSGFVKSAFKYLGGEFTLKLSKYVVIIIIMMAVCRLATDGIIEGETTAGFLGAMIGYLLSHKPE